MNYLFYRVIESNGFVAKRVIDKASYLILMIYGQVVRIDNRILMPKDWIEEPNASTKI